VKKGGGGESSSSFTSEAGERKGEEKQRKKPFLKGEEKKNLMRLLPHFFGVKGGGNKGEVMGGNMRLRSLATTSSLNNEKGGGKGK